MFIIYANITGTKTPRSAGVEGLTRVEEVSLVLKGLLKFNKFFEGEGFTDLEIKHLFFL